jgi:hypothetical protein
MTGGTVGLNTASSLEQVLHKLTEISLLYHH